MTSNSAMTDEFVAPQSAAAPRRRVMMRGLLGLSIVSVLPGVALAPSCGQATAGMPAPATPARTLPPTASAGAADRAEWAAFRARSVTPEGRVVDDANGGVSHSEGQGFAMVLAEWADDRATFETLLNWTRLHLSRPSDALFAWRHQPGLPMMPDDRNNATDGDLMIAWALQRAAARWEVPAWRQLATRMARDILRLSVREVAGRTLLLPGAYGFDKADRVVINPSYYNMPAIRALASLAPSAGWESLEADSHWLLDTARFGRWALPADWVEVMKTDGAVRIADGWPPRFSWDAIRVPLYLAWAGQCSAAPVAATAQFWTRAQPGTTPAWSDLRTGALAPYAGHAGIVAIAAIACAARDDRLAAAQLPAQRSASDYYGGALIMLARIARQEGPMARAGGAMLLSAR
jgi:endoglucanase